MLVFCVDKLEAQVYAASCMLTLTRPCSAKLEQHQKAKKIVTEKGALTKKFDAKLETLNSTGEKLVGYSKALCINQAVPGRL